ncbi:MAG TPA: hypothetical protein VK607_05305, partial [Kofleriaceae bacterium]|nr:hypothetical protein [Kofleriaceae bacterium]
FGVARIAEITRLDRLGLPAVSVIRRDPIGHSVSVCTGKATASSRPGSPGSPRRSSATAPSRAAGSRSSPAPRARSPATRSTRRA